MKELPPVGVEAAEVARAEATEAADAKVDAPSGGISSRACETTLQPDQWLTGGVDNLPGLGTSKVAVWDVSLHREANAQAVKEWQAAVNAKFYTAVPEQLRKCPETKTDTIRNQAGFTQEELEPLMEQRYW